MCCSICIASRRPRQEHADFWKDAAARYKDHPAVLFDLFNEPHGTTWEVWRDGGFVAEKKKAGDEDAFTTAEEKAKAAKGFQAIGMQALLDAVRATGAQNIVLVGGLDCAYDLSGIAKGFALEEKGGNGIIYSTHIYPWKKGWQEKVLVVADKYPILVGEVGANTKKMYLHARRAAGGRRDLGAGDARLHPETPTALDGLFLPPKGRPLDDHRMGLHADAGMGRLRQARAGGRKI